jgi:sugar phosphate isomerase/epimerase
MTIDAPKPKIYMGSWCFTFGLKRHVSLEQVVKTLSAFGFDGISIGAGYAGHAPVERYPDARSRKDLVAFVHAHDLEIAGYAPDPYGMPWATDDAAFDAYLTSFEDSLGLAGDIGSPTMRVDPGSYGPLAREADYDRVLERVVTTFRKQARQAADAGITLLWEVETAQIFVKPSEILRILDDVAMPNFKLNLDFAHAQGIAVLGHNQVQPVERLEGGAPELVRMIGHHIGDVGVNDTDGNVVTGVFTSHLGIGRGSLDVPAMLQAVVDAGFRGPWWGLDAIPMGEIVFQDAWTGVADLRSMLEPLLNG